MFQFGKPFAQLLDFIFKAQNVVRAGFNFVAQFFNGGLFLGNFRLQHVKLMPRQLRVEVLKFLGNLFVAARLAGLALERADLPFHFADESAMRKRFCSVYSSLRSDSFFCDLNFVMPAASSKIIRRSSGLLERICVMWPCARML